MGEETSQSSTPGPLSPDLIAEVAKLYGNFKYPTEFLTPKAKRELQDAYRARVREVYEALFGEQPENSPVMLNAFEEQMEMACKNYLRTH